MLTSPLHPLDVEVTGLTVGPLDAGQVETVVGLLATHGVVVLREQETTDPQFLALLRSLGGPAFTTGEPPLPGHPDLNVVSNVGRTTPPRSNFHIDTGYVAHPPAYTALRAVTVPRDGGQTLFTDQYRAADTLPTALRARLADATIRHVVTGLELGPGDEAAAEHPVLRTHPVSGRVGSAARTVGMLALLTLALPANLAVTAAALLATAVRGAPPRARPQHPRTVLVSGGKMTKSVGAGQGLPRGRAPGGTGRIGPLPTDRAPVLPRRRRVPPAAPAHRTGLHRRPAGDRGGRTGRRVGAGVQPRLQRPGRRRRGRAARALHRPARRPDQIATVDDKAAFAVAAAAAGLAVPDTHRITDPDQVVAFRPPPGAGPYVLKSIAYDAVHRLDLTPLPRPTPAGTAAFVAGKPIGADRPWVLQQILPGVEYCTHGTARDGVLTAYCCCRSSAFQLNYAPVDEPAIEAWVTRFVAAHRLTGQYSFDLIVGADGMVRALECNPRAHSAITLFADQPLALASAHLDDPPPAGGPLRPRPDTRPTYWLYQELWRLLRDPRRAAVRWRVLRDGRDAIFDPADPVPFLAVHHLQIPALLLANLARGGRWVRIDVNIGKLVEPDDASDPGRHGDLVDLSFAVPPDGRHDPQDTINELTGQVLDMLAQEYRTPDAITDGVRWWDGELPVTLDAAGASPTEITLGTTPLPRLEARRLRDALSTALRLAEEARLNVIDDHDIEHTTVQEVLRG